MKTFYHTQEMISESFPWEGGSMPIETEGVKNKNVSKGVNANLFSLQDKKVKQSQSNRLPRYARNDVAFTPSSFWTQRSGDPESVNHNELEFHVESFLGEGVEERDGRGFNPSSRAYQPIRLGAKRSLTIPGLGLRKVHSTFRFPLLTLIFLLFALSFQLKGQQRFQSSLYNLNGYSLNTAYAGLESCTEAFINQKNQYVGIDGAPVNTYLQAHTRLGQSFGIGLGINRWNVGLLTNNDFSIAGAYHLKLSETLKLSGSVNLGYYGYQLETQEVVAFDQDVVVNQGTLNDGGFYADLGLLLSHQNFEVGISTPRLLNSTAEFTVNNQNTVFDVERYLNIHGKYRYQLNDDFQLIPSAVVRTIPGDGAITDIFVGANYQNTFGLNLGYRTRNGLIAAIDYNYNDFLSIGYAFDAGMSNLNGISNGSHEVLVGIKICREIKKKEPKPEPVVEAPPAPKPVYQLQAKVQDEKGNPLGNEKVMLTNKTTGIVQELTTDSAGQITTNLDDSTDYEISINNPNYEAKTESFNTDGIAENKMITAQLTPKVASYYGTITDAKTGEGIPQVQVTLSNANENYTANTDEAGKFNINLKDKKLGNELNYEVNFKKKGYASDKDTLKDKVNNFEPKDLMKALKREAIVLEKFEEGADVAKLIDIKPIYFELGKFDINEEAAKELDKVVQIMNENPQMEVELGAHTDCRGSASLNANLSDKRAKAAAEYVKAKITNPERISGKGYGETQPLTTCECNSCSDEEHAKNRRTEFKILKME